MGPLSGNGRETEQADAGLNASLGNERTDSRRRWLEFTGTARLVEEWGATEADPFRPATVLVQRPLTRLTLGYRLAARRQG